MVQIPQRAQNLHRNKYRVRRPDQMNLNHPGVLGLKEQNSSGGSKVAEDDEAEQEKKKEDKITKEREWRLYPFCKDRHKGAGKGCLRRIKSTSTCALHPDGWKGTEIDE